MKFFTLVEFAFRLRRELAPEVRRGLWRLWISRLGPALRRYQKAKAAGQVAPPFLFISLTNACNLRCLGCWIRPDGPVDHLPPDIVHRLIDSAKSAGLSFFTLLGGEPLLYPAFWEIVETHRDCYFQVITNGLPLTRETAERFRQLGNVTPLISLDGFGGFNDARRGELTHLKILPALTACQEARLFFGVATTIFRSNFNHVLTFEYVQQLIWNGPQYLWFYILRPMGDPSSVNDCLGEEEIFEARKRILSLRRNLPILIIDTYWDENGRAICPAACGLGVHIGPKGSIEPCPPLSIGSNVLGGDTDPIQVIGNSKFLREFAQFVNERTRGCVIMEYPRELAQLIRSTGAQDFTGGRLTQLLECLPRLPSHHQPGREIPENTWLYRYLKRQLFFGLAGYG